MRAKIEITLKEPAGKRDLIELAEILTRLSAHVLRAGVVTPIKILAEDGAIVAILTIEQDSKGSQ